MTVTFSTNETIINWTSSDDPAVTFQVVKIAGGTGGGGGGAPDPHASTHAAAGSDPVALSGTQITSGTVAYARLPVGTTSSTVAAGDDSRLTDSRSPSGSAGGDLTGTYPNPTIASGAVTSAKIADGTIVNADISASAAIDTSKISGLAAIATSGSASDLTSGTVPTARLSTLVVGGQAAGSQLNEPSTATSLLTSTIATPVCAAGDVLILNAGINLVQNSGSSRNLTFAVKLGATTILSTVPSVSASATTRHMHLLAVIRVNSTTSQTASLALTFATAASGTTGVTAAATGTATETLSSASTIDLLVTATANTTQNYTLQYANLVKVAA